MRVLIVEDEREVADIIQRAVRSASWAPTVMETGKDALVALVSEEYDLLVLDVGLPDLDGFEVCRRARAQGSRTPVLLLTARNALRDRVTGLDAGADDYLPKPFDVEELLARLRALARRPATPLDVTLRLADLELDVATRTVRRGGRELRLTAREYALVEYLLRNPRRVVSRSQVLEHVWDDNFDPVGNAVDVLVSRVRRKVDAGNGPTLVHTVRNVGYVLTDRNAPDAA
ncbi:MAG TPA: response regulator transcription factor [Gemmatimonadales bacterium]|jgi:DNA-binding response OmpR family regulator